MIHTHTRSMINNFLFIYVAANGIATAMQAEVLMDASVLSLNCPPMMTTCNVYLFLYNAVVVVNKAMMLFIRLNNVSSMSEMIFMST